MDIAPASIHDDGKLHGAADNYLYLQGILFIKEIKASAPFHETSPMLNDISQLSDWARVHKGMIRLFQGEVLHKFPVIQHFLFGSILEATWEPAPVGSTTAPADAYGAFLRPVGAAVTGTGARIGASQSAHGRAIRDDAARGMAGTPPKASRPTEQPSDVHDAGTVGS